LITVIVPVLNETRVIAGTIEQRVDQDDPADRFEVPIVDGGSVDATRAIAGSLLAAADCSGLPVGWAPA
jgi:glycosyltransferase involved in cell wall biosynthesis